MHSEYVKGLIWFVYAKLGFCVGFACKFQFENSMWNINGVAVTSIKK